MRGVLENGLPSVVEVAVSAGDGPIGRVRGVFLHRAIPFGTDGVLNLVTDVTDERRMEDELRNYANVAAHDLREPVMAATYFLQVLARNLGDGRTEKNEELVELVRTSHARARSLVDGVLEYARSGTSLDRRDVDTGELMSEVATSLTSAVAELGGQIEVGDLPVVPADRDQLGRVLQNLVANGLKFHGEESPRIVVSAGHGDEVSGSGIGLAVCRKIVEAHGGAIWAEPAEGGGTAMRFTLPA